MGIGTSWAQGCLIGNGFVGTSQFSLKAWFSLLFIVLGIFVGAYLFLGKKKNKK